MNPVNFPDPVVDIMRDVVCKVKNNILATLQTADNKIQDLHYEHGHPVEIIQTLKTFDESPTKRYKKYPIVMLFQDFPEKRGVTKGLYSNVTLQLVIAHHTKADLVASERYRSTFRPILYPIYYELLKQIAAHPQLKAYSDIQLKHSKMDRLYWGSQRVYGNAGNILNDYIDAIEIKDLSIDVTLKNCIQPISKIN